MGLFYSLLSVSLFVPVIAGLYTRTFGKFEAIAAIVAGVSITLSAHLATGGGGYAGFTPPLLGLTAATVVGAVSFFARRTA